MYESRAERWDRKVNKAKEAPIPTRDDLRVARGGHVSHVDAYKVTDAEVWEMMLFEDCEACEGRGWNIFDSGWSGFECEDCTDGRVLRDGVFEVSAFTVSEFMNTATNLESEPRWYLVSASVVEEET